MQKEPFISVIVPAFNEERRLGGYLAEIVAFLSAEYPSNEVLVIDDGSRDRTKDIAVAILGSEGVISHSSNLGKGAAIATGMLHASGKFRLFTDADGSTPIAEVKKLLKEMERGFSIAIGSRALPTSNLVANPVRKGAGRVYAFLVRVLLGLPFQDTQCGFKLYSSEAARSVFSKVKTNGYSFDIEALCIARELGFSMVEVPVTWKHVAESKVSLVKDSVRMFFDILNIRRLHPLSQRSVFSLPIIQES